MYWGSSTGSGVTSEQASTVSRLRMMGSTASTTALGRLVLSMTFLSTQDGPMSEVKMRAVPSLPKSSTRFVNEARPSMGATRPLDMHTSALIL